ncbi:MAG TPA: YozE family protein [Polyangiaceae bacterium]|nr:YozE family protein [Polyangiaceae bacterium]
MSKFTTFYDWLGKQKNLQSPLGAWAREALRDESFPKEVANLEDLQAHLRAKEAGGATLATARLAWLTYARTGAKKA